MKHKCKTRKTARRQNRISMRRQKMYGGGQVPSFLARNLSIYDVLGAAVAALRPYANALNPAEMKEFEQALKASDMMSGQEVPDSTIDYLIERLKQLYAKYNAEESERSAAASPTPAPALAPAINIPPPPAPLPPIVAPAPAPYQPPPPPPFSPPMGRSVSAPAALSAGRRRVTRRRLRRPRRR